MEKIVKAGQIVTLKPQFLDPGEKNLPHVAVEDSDGGQVRVEVAGEYEYRFKPINVWETDWIA